MLATLFAAAAAQPYCRDSLAGLMECKSFMHDAAAPASCCAAYQAAFDADPFCLCYVADGTFARATGTDVARALQIPVSCGQVAPPIELCSSKSRRPASHSRVLSSVHVHDDFSFSDLFD
jgi:hypothetical protein